MLEAFCVNRLPRLIIKRAGQTSLLLIQSLLPPFRNVSRRSPDYYCNLILKMAVMGKKTNSRHLQPMAPSAGWVLFDVTDLQCNKQKIQKFSPFHFFLNSLILLALQKAQRDLEVLNCSREVGTKMNRSLSNGEPSKAHIQVATAAANEGQRRSMYNKNNRFLVK